MRKTRILASIAGIAAAGLMIAGCSGTDNGSSGSADSGDSIKLVLGHAGSTTDPRQWASEELAKRVSEATDGRVTIEVHSDSTLGSWEEMIDGLQLGSTDIVIESILSLEAYTDLAAVETAPFLYESTEQFFGVWDGELGQEIKDTISDASGYSMLGNMFRGSRELTTKTPVTQLSDLKGMTIRTPSAQTMLDTWNALGARAEALPFNEVYSAIESGVLDGQENPLDAIYFNSVHEVAPHIGLTKHMFANYHFLMWNDRLAELPDDVREAIETAAADIGKEYSQNTLDNEEQYTEDLKAEGAQFHEITDRQAWIDATESVNATLPDQVQAWIEQIRAM
ncbi:TRAP transporter substrate-binding protein [Microbacterium sp. YY-01]|uniref:TRAP transporter substrate-binding protein n=1 Tax=Microbacterium sp. YY-01 TaxID=3421634 RepID=UPI003D17AD02